MLKFLGHSHAGLSWPALRQWQREFESCRCFLGSSEPRFLSGVILPNRSELKDVFSQIVLLIWEARAPEVVRASWLYHVQC